MAKAFLAEDSGSQERLARVAKLIEGFETPFGMELLATVHWLASREEAPTPESILAKVKDWEPSRPDWGQRKAALMKTPHVKAAIVQLESRSWI